MNDSPKPDPVANLKDTDIPTIGGKPNKLIDVRLSSGVLVQHEMKGDQDIGLNVSTGLLQFADVNGSLTTYNMLHIIGWSVHIRRGRNGR